MSNYVCLAASEPHIHHTDPLCRHRLASTRRTGTGTGRPRANGGAFMAGNPGPGLGRSSADGHDRFPSACRPDVIKLPARWRRDVNIIIRRSVKTNRWCCRKQYSNQRTPRWNRLWLCTVTTPPRRSDDSAITDFHSHSPWSLALCSGTKGYSVWNTDLVQLSLVSNSNSSLLKNGSRKAEGDTG